MTLNPMVKAAAIGGFAAGTYWLLMLVGRLVSSFIASKVSSRAMMIVTNGAAMILILLAMFLPKSITGSMPVFTGSGFQVVTLPLSAILIVFCGHRAAHRRGLHVLLRRLLLEERQQGHTGIIRKYGNTEVTEVRKYSHMLKHLIILIIRYSKGNDWTSGLHHFY